MSNNKRKITNTSSIATPKRYRSFTNHKRHLTKLDVISEEYNKRAKRFKHVTNENVSKKRKQQTLSVEIHNELQLKSERRRLNTKTRLLNSNEVEQIYFNIINEIYTLFTRWKQYNDEWKTSNKEESKEEKNQETKMERQTESKQEKNQDSKEEKNQENQSDSKTQILFLYKCLVNPSSLREFKMVNYVSKLPHSETVQLHIDYIKNCIDLP